MRGRQHERQTVGMYRRGAALVAVGVVATGVPIALALTVSANLSLAHRAEIPGPPGPGPAVGADVARAAFGDKASPHISAVKAIGIAQGKVPGAPVTGVESERLHGQYVWEIELEKDQWEHEVYISMKTGEIVHYAREGADHLVSVVYSP